jgi:hypothetical protein
MWSVGMCADTCLCVHCHNTVLLSDSAGCPELCLVGSTIRPGLVPCATVSTISVYKRHEKKSRAKMQGSLVQAPATVVLQSPVTKQVTVAGPEKPGLHVAVQLAPIARPVQLGNPPFVTVAVGCAGQLVGTAGQCSIDTFAGHRLWCDNVRSKEAAAQRFSLHAFPHSKQGGPKIPLCRA